MILKLRWNRIEKMGIFVSLLVLWNRELHEVLKPFQQQGWLRK